MNEADSADFRFTDSHAGPSRVGEMLANKYHLLKRLGEGGMGAVYEAQHTIIGRRFAVKFLHKELANNREILARFQREAQTAGTIESENIVAVTDFGTADDGCPYIVMEHLDGEVLRGLLERENRLSVERAVNIGIQVCRGLDAAHALGIVHRDLKPENLFITKRGDGTDLVKILDFGIAKLRHSSGTSVATRTGIMIGTLHYMPPEQVRGDKNIDQRADIYALGAILYELLSGTIPHPGNAAHEMVYHIMHEPIAPLASLRPELPQDLADAVHRSLASSPDDRFQTVREFAQLLERFAGRQATPFNCRPPPAPELDPDKTSPAVFSEVRQRAEPSQSRPGVSAEPLHFDTEQALVASGVTRLDASRMRAIAVVGMLAITALFAWLWLFHAGSSGPTDHPNQSDTANIVQPATPIPSEERLRSSVSATESIANTATERPEGKATEKVDVNRVRSAAQHASERADKPASGRPLADTGRPHEHGIERPKASKSFRGSDPSGSRRSSRKDKPQTRAGVANPGKAGSEDSSATRSSTASESSSSVIERRRGRRTLKFDRKSPY